MIGKGWEPLATAFEKLIHKYNRLNHESVELVEFTGHNNQLCPVLLNSTTDTNNFATMLMEASMHICEECGAEALKDVTWQATCKEHL